MNSSGYFLSFSGDVLIFLNKKNLLQPPVACSIDRIQSEFAALRRQKQPIQLGICRSPHRSYFNQITIKHLGSLACSEFDTLAQQDESTTTRKLSNNGSNDSKKILQIFSNKKKTTANDKPPSSPNRDSGFVEIDGRSWEIRVFPILGRFLCKDPSLISSKYRSKISPDKSEEDNSLATLKSSDFSEQWAKKTTKVAFARTDSPTDPNISSM